MPETISTVRTSAERAADATLRLGPAVFSLAFAALGIETLIYARVSTHGLGPQYNVIPVIPWLPAIPWLAYAFGGVLVFGAAGLLWKRLAWPAGMTLGGLLFLCTLVLEVPKNAVNLGSMSLRTGVFEPLALACLAWLAPGPGVTPGWLARASRYLLALSLIVFGVDHFLALAPIASLIPAWIPWRVFWVAFFGAAFIASGLSIAFNWLLRELARPVLEPCSRSGCLRFIFPEFLDSTVSPERRRIPTSGRACSLRSVYGAACGRWRARAVADTSSRAI